MNPALLDNMQLIDKNTAFQILVRIAVLGVEIHIKGKDSSQIHKTRIKKNAARPVFFVLSPSIEFESGAEVTFKIIVDKKLYFLKTQVKQSASQYYFDHYTDFFELIRRKKPRFAIPELWSQSCKVQAMNSPADLKAPAEIIDLSRAGMRLLVRPSLPRFEINQLVHLYFKIYRRAEIMVVSKVIYLKKNEQGGPTLGLEFSDNSILIGNKIQNVCDDLAFFYTSENNLR